MINIKISNNNQRKLKVNQRLTKKNLILTLKFKKKKKKLETQLRTLKKESETLTKFFQYYLDLLNEKKNKFKIKNYFEL